MSADRPESVFDDEKQLHRGHNCVACVAAVLYNETNRVGFMTANRVAKKYSIDPKFGLTVERGVEIIREIAKLDPSPGRLHPWDASAPIGHYAVFCIGRRHVIYGNRMAEGRFYLYDPQTESDWSLDALEGQGYGPFRSYHFS